MDTTQRLGLNSPLALCFSATLFFATASPATGGLAASEAEGRVFLDVQPQLIEQPGNRGRAIRVAAPVPLVARVADLADVSVRPTGETVWRLRLDSPGARFMSAKFSRFVLGPGAEVSFVAQDGVHRVGPFTSRHNKNTGRFGSPMVAGDSMTIEVVTPAGHQAPDLVLESVSHGFRDALGIARLADAEPGRAESDAPRGGPFSCQRDITCPEGAPYLQLKDAAAEGYDGEYVCSGQLVNNTLQDGRYLYLTAAHCEWWRDPSTMTYYWDYANQTCGGNDYPAFRVSTGSTDLYHSTNSDFDINLLELDGAGLEDAYDVYYAGWNRGESAPTSSAAISHPDDKPLQIALDNDPATDCAQGGCPFGWGPWYWRIDDYEVGVTEGGSSGGGLYDQQQRLVGVLTGGVGTNCDNFGWDEYFKLSAEWDELEPYLDPAGSGAMTVPGWDGSSTPCTADLTGDGVLDLADISAFVVGFNAADAVADMNGDGIFDLTDLSLFVAAFVAGCA